MKSWKIMVMIFITGCCGWYASASDWVTYGYLIDRAGLIKTETISAAREDIPESVWESLPYTPEQSESEFSLKSVIKLETMSAKRIFSNIAYNQLGGWDLAMDLLPLQGEEKNAQREIFMPDLSIINGRRVIAMWGIKPGRWEWAHGDPWRRSYFTCWRDTFWLVDEKCNLYELRQLPKTEYFGDRQVYFPYAIPDDPLFWLPGANLGDMRTGSEILLNRERSATPEFICGDAGLFGDQLFIVTEHGYCVRRNLEDESWSEPVRWFEGENRCARKPVFLFEVGGGLYCYKDEDGKRFVPYEVSGDWTKLTPCSDLPVLPALALLTQKNERMIYYLETEQSTQVKRLTFGSHEIADFADLDGEEVIALQQIQRDGHPEVHFLVQTTSKLDNHNNPVMKFHPVVVRDDLKKSE
ncbi:hypothetical protein [Victivallis sp. Marseille-Q1083]|uniref:hypothetical protein n=1 Tax=Victivallis sp. Marseille-Q1083 TaxID=2717288 RepID=UPI00158F4266|nr:hypothetical protein [Victivallis sp. Marseille-Q1083]